MNYQITISKDLSHSNVVAELSKIWHLEWQQWAKRSITRRRCLLQPSQCAQYCPHHWVLFKRPKNHSSPWSKCSWTLLINMPKTSNKCTLAIQVYKANASMSICRTITLSDLSNQTLFSRVVLPLPRKGQHTWVNCAQYHPPVSRVPVSIDYQVKLIEPRHYQVSY